MESKSKLWLGLGVVCIAGATLNSCSESSEKPDMDSGMDNSAMTANYAEVGEGGEGGEAGEGGEGGEAAKGNDAISNDAVYLEQLAYIRGHLNVGVNLYREGDAKASETHMKHPESEIYANLLPALKHRKAPEFGDQLASLAAAVEQKQTTEKVDAAYQQVLAGISQAEAVVKEQNATLLGEVIVALIKTTAAEYDMAVAGDLTLENIHEYQDSLGFLRTAKELLPRLESMTDNTEAVAAIQKQLDLISPAWTGLQAPDQLKVEPSVIYGAASRIEIATQDL